MTRPVAYALLISPVLFGFLGGGAALAASPAYCALYAREYASARIGTPVTTEDSSALQRVEDQAYYRCLNQDEAPQFPTTSAYFGAPLQDITGDGDSGGGPFQALQLHQTRKVTADAASSDTGGGTSVTTATQAAASTATAGTSGNSASPPTRLADLASPVAGKGHGAPGTPAWAAWCHAHYRSFDEKSGMVLTFSGDKKQCP